MLEFKQLYKQIKHIWLKASSSYNKTTLWLGIIIPSLFINFLMLALPLAMLQAYDRIIPNSSTATLTMLILLVISAAIIEMILRMLRAIITSWAFAREDYLLVTQLSEGILRAPISAQENAERETILTFSDLINRSKHSHHEQVIVNFLDLIFVLIFLRLIGYIGGALVLVPITMMGILAYQLYKRDDKLKSRLHAQKEWERKRTSSIVDALTSIFTLKALAMEPSILRRSEHIELKKAESIYDINLINMEINGLVSFYSQLIFFLTVAIGSLFVMYGSVTVGGLAACTLLAGRGMQPITKFVGLWGQRKEAQTSQGFLNKVYALNTEPQNRQGLQRIIEGHITFEHIYTGNRENNYIIEDLSLDIAPCQTIYIQDDGSSIWSLFYILMRFIPPVKGNVLIDSYNINDYNLNSLRQQICYMPKEGPLYNGTILENISGFDPSKETIAREIGMQIGLENIISKLPQGLDTKVGPNAGQIFSAGFRQLVTFVRTMVNSPKIVLFNNITFNVDKQTLRLLINAINLYKNKMTILIASTEPSLLPSADKIYTLYHKKIEEPQHDRNA